MATGDIYVNCLSSDTIEDLIRVVCVTSDCETDYITCDNSEESLMDLLRLLVREDANGNPAIAVCGCDGGGGTGATIKQGVETCLAGVPFTPSGWGTNFANVLYSLHIDIYSAGGASIGFTLDSKTVSGFTVTPTATGTINWSAIAE